LPILYSNSIMKTIHLLSSVTLLALLTACNSGIDHSEEKAAAMPAQTVQQPATPTPGTTTPTTGTTAALNPAHGQPGHNCDLPVGAPLNAAVSGGTVPAQGSIAPITLPSNSAPAGGAAAQQVQMTPANPAQALPSSGATARLNPAHGQPGHDCNIPVGQPLRQ
jgi:hypothetical protein